MPRPIDRAVALGRLERRRLPLRLVARRHHVVVPVEQDGRSALRAGDLAGDHRRRIRQLERAEVLDTCVAQELDDQVVGVEQRLARLLRIVRQPRPMGSGRAARARTSAAGSNDSTTFVIDSFPDADLGGVASGEGLPLGRRVLPDHSDRGHPAHHPEGMIIVPTQKQKTPPERGFREADDGTRTHDLLHGKQTL